MGVKVESFDEDACSKSLHHICVSFLLEVTLCCDSKNYWDYALVLTFPFFEHSFFSRKAAILFLDNTSTLLPYFYHKHLRKSWKENVNKTCICPKVFQERFFQLWYVLHPTGFWEKSFPEHVSKNVGHFSVLLRVGFRHQFVKDFRSH